LMTRFTATSVRDDGSIVAEAYDLVSPSRSAIGADALGQIILERAQSNQSCP